MWSSRSDDQTRAQTKAMWGYIGKMFSCFFRYGDKPGGLIATVIGAKLENEKVLLDLNVRAIFGLEIAGLTYDLVKKKWVLVCLRESTLSGESLTSSGRQKSPKIEILLEVEDLKGTRGDTFPTEPFERK